MWYCFPCHPFRNHPGNNTYSGFNLRVFTCLSQYVAQAVLSLIILLGLEGWRGNCGSIFLRGREALYFHSSFWGQSIFWTLSSAALWPSYVHLIKGGDVCLNDSEFLPEIHLPQSGNFLSKRKLNLLAILNSYVYQKKKKKPPTSGDWNNSWSTWKIQPPANPHVDPHPFSLLSISRTNVIAVKDILKIPLPHLNKGYIRKAGHKSTHHPPHFGSPGLLAW